MRIRIFCVIFAFLLCGCISVPKSPDPRLYMLQAAGKDNVGQRFDVPSDVIIEVGPVKIPGYLDRPQIVTEDKNKMLKFAQFDRWGEPLNSGLAQVITLNLAQALPGASLHVFPYDSSIPFKYQLILDVVQLESELDKDLFFVVQWSIIDAPKNKMLLTKKSEFRQPINPHDYTGLTAALSTACVSLSAEIAEALAKQQK